MARRTLSVLIGIITLHSLVGVLTIWRKETEMDDESLKKALEEKLAQEMSVEAFRNAVVRHIWHDDLEGLRQTCKRQITLSFFLEKVIDEISPGNSWNDMLFLIARWVMEADPSMRYYADLLSEKRPLVRN